MNDTSQPTTPGKKYDQGFMGRTDFRERFYSSSQTERRELAKPARPSAETLETSCVRRGASANTKVKDSPYSNKSLKIPPSPDRSTSTLTGYQITTQQC